MQMTCPPCEVSDIARHEPGQGALRSCCCCEVDLVTQIVPNLSVVPTEAALPTRSLAHHTYAIDTTAAVSHDLLALTLVYFVPTSPTMPCAQAMRLFQHGDGP
eukprot:10547815-Alexandrium_andersonii.AAC.1